MSGKQDGKFRKIRDVREYTWNAISDKWILISPDALNTQGTNSISNDSHEEVWRGSWKGLIYYGKGI